jgi:hypothetical protein
MKTLEEKREYDRVRMAKWLRNHPEARERNRLRNVEWRAKDRVKYNQYQSEWKSNNIDRVRSYKWKARFGITSEKYTEMLISQGGVCAICGQEETAQHNTSNRVQKLAVDHCHITGKIRGLLCQDCNRGISKFHDDPTILKNAIEYLTQ